MASNVTVYLSGVQWAYRVMFDVIVVLKSNLDPPILEVYHPLRTKPVFETGGYVALPPGEMLWLATDGPPSESNETM